MKPTKSAENARLLLEELKSILEKEDGAAWVKGIVAAIGCLERSDIEQGYDEAKSIYTTMVGGKGAFSDYYIQRDDAFEQAEVNRRLDVVRDQLWQLFQSE